MFDYTELDNLLAGMNAAANAPECHGFLSGVICSAGVAEEQLWQDFLDIQTLDDEQGSMSFRQKIGRLAEEIRTELQSFDLDFRLLMPDDDAPLGERTSALSNWCHGFLNGYGMGAAASPGIKLPEDCREVVDDLTRICRLAVPDESQPGDETALNELVEFVRIGVITIFTEMSSGFPVESASKVVH
jgi:hypothetical protein